MTPSVFGTHMRKRALTATAAAALLGLALPASSLAAISEVGGIENTTPATVPSCTAGPLGSFGLHLEEEKKQAEKLKSEAERKKAEAERKKGKKKRAKKSSARHRRHARTARRASVASGRSHARRQLQRSLLLDQGGLAAPLASKARIAASTTETQTQTPESEATTESTTTESTEAPCLAVSRTTGFQVKVGKVRNPLVVPRNGRIVAWTISLGKPTASQIKFFDENEGGAASAAISILYPAKKQKLTYHLLAQTQVLKLEPYFGMTVQLPLAKTIKVKKGDVVALTVPTWAPALALGFGKNTSWRASRQKSQCSTTNSQTAQTELKSNLLYACSYQTARLTYSATLISTP